MHEEMVLCAASAYERKFYLNPEFNSLPEEVKQELQIMCVLYTADVGGILMVVYDENGNLNYCDTYQYDYNTLGDLLCCTRYRDRGNGEVVEGQIQYEYRYDVYGNMLYYESHYWGHKIENEYVYR